MNIIMLYQLHMLYSMELYVKMIINGNDYGHICWYWYSLDLSNNARSLRPIPWQIFR
jgi:hypothetical protein